MKVQKSSKQIADSWKLASAEKKALLLSTDWTQLDDVNLENSQAFSNWRKKLREVNLQETFETSSQAREFLKLFREKMPKPVFIKTSNNNLPDDTDYISQISNLKLEVKGLNVLVHQLVDSLKRKESAYTDKDVDIEEIPYAEAKLCVISDIQKRKHAELLDAGALTFPLLSEKAEQAIDFLASSNDTRLNTYSLFHHVSDKDEVQHANNIISLYKKLREQLNDIELRYLQEESKVHNMTHEEINEYLNSHGHRYRCQTHSEG